jgi:predicted nucleotidyltransferase
MIIKVEISEETWARMLTGKRAEGTIGYDKWTGEADFNAFHRKSREPGYVAERTVLYQTERGHVYMTPKTFGIKVTSRRSLGRKRCAENLLKQARELTDHLRDTKTIEEIMDEA